MAAAQKSSERRTEHLMAEILEAQGWDLRRPPSGDVLRQQEYRAHPHLLDLFKGRSKTGPGSGIPEALLVDRVTLAPLAVIEAKADIAGLDQAIAEATRFYGNACVAAGYPTVAIALAGASEDAFALRVLKWNGQRWVFVTYDGAPITWIPNRDDMARIASAKGQSELRPTVPPPEVLAQRADEINRLLRESGIKDEFRPAVIGAVMLALWSSKGNIRKEPENILSDINRACEQAFQRAKKPELANSLGVDEANEKLAVKARRIASILERLNITVLTAEYDYLGILYETFFRYTGGNTIGQYFTPRHIAAFMADLADISPEDIVFDPACGTGGFLVAAMNRLRDTRGISRTQLIKLVQKRLLGFDDEPITAALCVANMILRGDGSTGVRRADCFTSPEFPTGKATVVLMNPPFPHVATDRPPEDFIDRALEALQHRGRLAVIVPMHLLVKADKHAWRRGLLEKHTLDGIITLPDELFQPYAQPYTNVLLVTKGIPHNFTKPVFFARIDNDGLRLRKGVRVARPGSQIASVLDAYQSRATILGVCGNARITSEDDWRPGAYIPARPLTDSEVLEEVGTLIRSESAFVVRFSPQFRRLRERIKSGELSPRDFHEYVGGRTYAPVPGGVVGSYFEIFYGQKELESKDGLGEGDTPVISSSGENNGCHGFYDFDWLIAPPFVTVPRTGSMGKAHVQEWPCGASSDNLVLVPRKKAPRELLYVVAAVIRRERWRFNYGSKITPERIANFPVPNHPSLLRAIAAKLAEAEKVKRVALGA